MLLQKSLLCACHKCTCPTQQLDANMHKHCMQHHFWCRAIYMVKTYTTLHVCYPEGQPCISQHVCIAQEIVFMKLQHSMASQPAIHALPAIHGLPAAVHSCCYLPAIQSHCQYRRTPLASMLTYCPNAACCTLLESRTPLRDLANMPSWCRSSGDLYANTSVSVAASALWRLPLVYLVMNIIRIAAITGEPCPQPVHLHIISTATILMSFALNLVTCVRVHTLCPDPRGGQHVTLAAIAPWVAQRFHLRRLLCNSLGRMQSLKQCTRSLGRKQISTICKARLA